MGGKKKIIQERSIETIDREVYPFTRKDLKRCREILKEENKIVILSLIDIGVNTALRYSDLSKLKFEDIKSDKTIKIFEKKTGKKKEIKLNSICYQAIINLKNYYKEKGIKQYDKGYLFKSQNRKYLLEEIDFPLTNYSFNRYLKKLGKDLGIEYNIGSHSLRKTWGKFYYEKYKDIGTVMKILNHSSEMITLKYIGIERKKILEIYDRFLI